MYDNTHAIFTFSKYTFFINQTAIPFYIALFQTESPEQCVSPRVFAMHVFSAPAEVTTFGIMEGVGQFLPLTRIFCTFRSYARSLLQWFTMPISFLLQKLNRNLFLQNLPNLNGQNNSAPYPGETFCSGHCKVVFALVSVTVQTATDLETSYYQWLSKKFQNKPTSNNKWRITWLEDFPSLQ